jgi:hypothetical protein
MLYRMKGAAAGSEKTAPKEEAGTAEAAPKAAAKEAGKASEVAEEVLELVSPVVAALADMYHRVERGEIDLYKEE